MPLPTCPSTAWTTLDLALRFEVGDLSITLGELQVRLRAWPCV